MENKLQQLTEKLYNEGLSKGRQDAEQMVADAKSQAARIIADAKSQAETIKADAQKEAAQLKTNTENEIRLASGQMRSNLRQQIEGLILMQVVNPQVSQAWKDNSFIKELALTAVSQLNPEQGLQVILPESRGAELADAVKNAVAEKFNGTVDVTTDSHAKVPFRIAPKEGGYYISFTDADFDALFKSYLRPRVAELLFGGQQTDSETK